jgi:hypothetical protein
MTKIERIVNALMMLDNDLHPAPCSTLRRK